jgi:hypothetical protein
LKFITNSLKEKGMQGEKGCKGKKDAGEKGKRKTKKGNENSFT